MNTHSPAALSRLETIFGLDLRSLALFRVLLGAVLLGALLNTFCELGALYSDNGVAPRSWVMDLGSSSRISMYFFNGSTLFATLLLLIQTAAALLLLLGWRTRLVSLISFALWISLMSRNPAALTPGDSVIAGLLFWSLFLPLAARYSVESALSSDPLPAEHPHLSWASAGLLLQTIAPFFFSALAGYNTPQLHESLTLHYLLNLDQYSNAAGHWLLNFPNALATLSRIFYGISLILPLLVFSPVFTQATRLLAMAGLLAMQVFALVFLDAGTLPWACIAALCVLPQAPTWVWLRQRDERRNTGALHIYYDRDHAFSRAMCQILRTFLMLPRAVIAEAQDTPRTRSLMQANQSWIVLDAQDQATMKWSALVTLLKQSPLFCWLALPLSAAWLEKPGNALYDALARQRSRLDAMSARCMSAPSMRAGLQPCWTFLAALMLAITLLWNFAATQWLPSSLGGVVAPVVEVLRLDQKWMLYSPSTLENDGWLMVPAKRVDGSEVDLLRPDQGVPDFSKPSHAIIAADGLRWVRYREHLWQDNNAGQRRLYADYLCRQWNRAHRDTPSQQITQLTLIYMLERTAPPGSPPAQIEQRLLSSHDCLLNN